LENHRNVQINNIQNDDVWKTHSTADGTTIKSILSAIPDILDINYDQKHSRLNCSVDRKNFAAISNNLFDQLSKTNFSFHPKVRNINTRSSSNSQGSTTSAATKYSEILSCMISSANSYASSNVASNPTNRKNVWKTSVPAIIDFSGNTSAHFPPLRPTSPTTDNHSQTTASDGITTSTIKSAIQEAISEVQQKHHAEIKAMKEDYKNFQAEIASLRHQLDQQTNSTTNRLEQKIDLLMQQQAIGQGEQVGNPVDTITSPFRKKQRNESSKPVFPTDPTSPTDHDSLTSSQDGAEAPSGSEN
jgi:hypothetical protein